MPSNPLVDISLPSFQLVIWQALDKCLLPCYPLAVKTFRQYNESQTAQAKPRLAYILLLAETMDAPEIASLLGVSRQRVHQLVKKARALQKLPGFENGELLVPYRSDKTWAKYDLNP